CSLDGVLQGPTRPPSQFLPGPLAIEPEQTGLMGVCLRRLMHHAGAFAPGQSHQLRHLTNRRVVAGVGSEVPGPGITGTILTGELFCKAQVSRERLEHVLPWSYGVRAPQPDRMALFECPQAIGDQTFGGP